MLNCIIKISKNREIVEDEIINRLGLPSDAKTCMNYMRPPLLYESVDDEDKTKVS